MGTNECRVCGKGTSSTMEICGVCQRTLDDINSNQYERLRITAPSPQSAIRKFETGATRNTDNDKYDYEGFESPLVIKRFGKYMHKHRKQADGNLRGSDNWQKGMPINAYMSSMLRHLMDVWLHHDGFGDKAVEPLEDALCALRFNVNGYLFEVLREVKV